MKKLLTLSLTVLVMIAACSKADKPEANAVAEQKQPTKQETMDQTQKPSGPEWPADYPVGDDSVAVITVEQEGVGELGEIVLEFYADKAPNHVRNFKWLANKGFYDGVIFHRVIKGFMIQGGDPEGTGMGGPGWNVDAEFNDTPHTKGVLSAARSQHPNSAGSQFFICHGDPKHLDGKYTAYGNTIKGLDVVDKIAETEVGGPQGYTPLKKIVMKSVKIVPRSEVKL